MHILVLNERKGEREAMVKALPQSSDRIDAVADERSAIEIICREPPEILVISAAAKGSDDLVRRLRNADASAQAYVIAILDAAPAHKDLLALLSAGVNDFLRRPVVDAELIERVRAPTRLLRWVKSVDKPMAFDFSTAVDVARLNAWRQLGSTVAEDLSQIAGQTFSVCDGWPKRFAATVCGATIPMSLAGDQLEVRVSIAVDAPSTKWVREILLADPSANDAAVEDVLREFANTAGGALKRSALHEGVSLTTGMPANEQLSNSPQRVCWTLELEGSDACFAVLGEIVTRENQRVPVMNLCEGMIVAHDVRTESGVLLVTAGSRLSSTTAAKLSKILGPRTFLEVAPAA